MIADAVVGGSGEMTGLPEPGEVDVVLRSLWPSPESSVLRAWRELLSTDELERLGRLRSTKARTEVLASRSLLRVVLGRLTGVDPREWRFGSSATGRPTILEPAELRGALWFSLSHTEGVVGCAVATHEEIGLDLELASREIDGVQLAARFFSEAEASTLASMPVVDRASEFLKLWTLKESYFKARGLGIAAGLERVRFSIVGGDVRFEVDSDLDDATGWRFRIGETSTGHAVAIASRPLDQLSVRFVDPSGAPTDGEIRWTAARSACS